MNIHRKYDEVKSNSRRVLHQSNCMEWYTPEIYVDAAYDVMGTIDLDPASCTKANEVVKATTIYTLDDTGGPRIAPPTATHLFISEINMKDLTGYSQSSVGLYMVLDIALRRK